MADGRGWIWCRAWHVRGSAIPVRRGGAGHETRRNPRARVRWSSPREPAAANRAGSRCVCQTPDCAELRSCSASFRSALSHRQNSMVSEQPAPLLMSWMEQVGCWGPEQDARTGAVDVDACVQARQRPGERERRCAVGGVRMMCVCACAGKRTGHWVRGRSVACSVGYRVISWSAAKIIGV